MVKLFPLALIVAIFALAAALPVSNDGHPIYGAIDGLFQANQFPFQNVQSIPNAAFGVLFREFGGLALPVPDSRNSANGGAVVSAASASDGGSSVFVRRVVRI